MQKALILSFFIFSLLSGVSFATNKSEMKSLNKLYCKDIKEKQFPKRGIGLFRDGTEVEINKHTTYFYKNSFYKLINKYKKKQTYVELDKTNSSSSKFYTEFNYYDNDLNYTFYGVFPVTIFQKDGKKIYEYYKKNKDKVGIFIIKLNKQTLNGSYEFKKAEFMGNEYIDTTSEFICEISSRKI